MPRRSLSAPGCRRHNATPPNSSYTQASCAESQKVRNWLNSLGVTFTERDVTGDYDAARDLLATGVFGTPLLVTNETIVMGFRPAALAAALKRPEIAE
jgi:arsenate reductase-like glutaredoxin family protein